MQISIIGAGNMAAGVATRALAGGHLVLRRGRDHTGYMVRRVSR